MGTKITFRPAHVQSMRHEGGGGGRASTGIDWTPANFMLPTIGFNMFTVSSQKARRLRHIYS